MSEVPSSPEHLFKDYFEKATEVPSLAGFYHYDPDLFFRNCDKSDIVGFWNKAFKAATVLFGIQKSSKKQPDWTFILQKLLSDQSECLDPEASHGKSSKSSSSSCVATNENRKRAGTMSSNSSKTDSCPLTEEAKQQFNANFESMRNTDKWFLRKGKHGDDVFVEDIMFAFGQECGFEHPVHSYILDLGDPCWDNLSKSENSDKYFTPEDKRTILSEGNYKLPPLDPSIHNIFDKHFLSVSSILDSQDPDISQLLDALWESITQDGYYNPRKEFDMYWIQQTLVGFLDLYRKDKLKEMTMQGSEMDLVIQCWSKLDRCFDDLGIVGRDRTCMSTLARVNSLRAITGFKPIEDQRSSIRPDLLVLRDGLELAVAECGKADAGGISKKELIEKNLHVPKLMKDMYNHALSKGKNMDSLARALRIVSFNESSLRMQVSILDCPKGYVSRLVRLEKEEIPVDPTLITSSLFSLMKSVLQAKAIVKSTISQVKQHQRQRPNSEPGYASEYTTEEREQEGKRLYLPASLTLSCKKQKKF